MLVGGHNVTTAPETKADLDAAVAGLLDRFIAHAETDPRMQGVQDQAIANALAWIVGFASADAILRISALRGGMTSDIVVGVAQMVGHKAGMSVQRLPAEHIPVAAGEIMAAVHVGAMKNHCDCVGCQAARGGQPRKART
ncbi:hypothetical protein [Caulobacter sp. 1776]|uniref:hypothetical protein n=1 Tax=Caulobacter sp. 1776 TaxID=3156420 RepID=UPI0033960C4D